MSMSEREAHWTAPPTAILFTEPGGTLRWAEVFRDGTFVGAVWITEDVRARPRAGIVLAEADEAFQDDLGDLAVSAFDTDWEADDWINLVAETRTGASGKLMVGNVQRSKYDAIKRRCGLTS